MMTELSQMVTLDYLLTSLIVVLIPGTGVIYTLSIGIFAGRTQSLAAAVGCTFGIVPHLLASIFGLAALLHASAALFSLLKIAGVAYLLYLAVMQLRDKSALGVSEQDAHLAGTGAGLGRLRRIAVRGTLINVLNQKLSLFFLAFLPQFLPAGTAHPLASILVLAGIFMAMTLGVFALYGLFASQVRDWILASERAVRWCKRVFALSFAGFAVKLAVTDRG